MALTQTKSLWKEWVNTFNLKQNDCGLNIEQNGEGSIHFQLNVSPYDMPVTVQGKYSEHNNLFTIMFIHMVVLLGIARKMKKRNM